MLKPPLRVRAQSCPLLYTPVSCALVVLTCLAQYLVRPKRRQTDKINAGTPTNRSLYSPRFEMFYSQRNKATVIRFVEGYSNILQLFYKMEGVLIHITLRRSYTPGRKQLKKTRYWLRGSRRYCRAIQGTSPRWWLSTPATLAHK